MGTHVAPAPCPPRPRCDEASASGGDWGGRELALQAGHRRSELFLASFLTPPRSPLPAPHQRADFLLLLLFFLVTVCLPSEASGTIMEWERLLRELQEMGPHKIHDTLLLMDGMPTAAQGEKPSTAPSEVCV